jgi:antitoxin VapB
MSLNLKNPETHQLVKELAALTGESMTQAVTGAVREKLQRVRSEKEKGDLVERLLEIGQRCAPLFEEPWKSMDHGDLLYDELGLPK